MVHISVDSGPIGLIFCGQLAYMWASFGQNMGLIGPRLTEKGIEQTRFLILSMERPLTNFAVSFVAFLVETAIIINNNNNQQSEVGEGMG